MWHPGTADGSMLADAFTLLLASSVSNLHIIWQTLCIFVHLEEAMLI